MRTNSWQDDEDYDARNYFRGRRRIPSPVRRDGRAVRTNEEELVPQQQRQAVPYGHNSHGYEQRYGAPREIPEPSYRQHRYNVHRNERIDRRNRSRSPRSASPPEAPPLAGRGATLLLDNEDEDGEIGELELGRDEVFAAVEEQLYRALSPLLGDQQQHQANAPDNEASTSRASENQDYAGMADEQDGPGQPIAESPVNNPAVDFPDPELITLIADLRADPAIHRAEYRNNPKLGSRTPGETDAGFKPSNGDIVVRIRPLSDGTFLEYYTKEIPQKSPLQSGDRVVRIFVDNTSDIKYLRAYAELHMCVGNQGGTEPRFLYFGKSDESMPVYRGG